MRRWTIFLGISISALAADRVPLPIKFEDSASYSWLNKKVLASRLLDDMESLATWVHQDPGEMTLTRERSRDGGQSLRLRAPTKTDKPGPGSGRLWGTAGVARVFKGEDWRDYNRISFWIYPDFPGFHVVSLLVRLSNDGVEKVPDVYQREGLNHIVVRNHEWNRVVWEIPHLARGEVTGIAITHKMGGNEPEASDMISFDIDRLELERVEADHFEGWNVWPGRISYSHTGYQPGSSKTAVASNLAAREFQLIRQESGEIVLSKPIRTEKTHLGQFQVMDFSEVRDSGSYVIRAGGALTRPFRIDQNVWKQTIWKAINFFYTERCGMAIPGTHRICHRDWLGVHGDKKIVINGGWHDAGDLSQGLVNTSEADYAMFSLAERLRQRDEDPELYRRLVEEGKWGLEWILKTNFGDG